MPTTTVTKNNTLLPINILIVDGNGNPVDLSMYTVKAFIVDATGTVIVNNLTTGITPHPTQTFTAATTDYLTCNGHGLKEGNQIILSSTGTLPAGLATATRYFPIDIGPNDFKVATRPGGTPVDITGTGTSTHSFYSLGSLQYDPQAGDVDAVGMLTAHINLFGGTGGLEFQSAPFDGDTWLLQVVSPRGA